MTHGRIRIVIAWAGVLGFCSVAAGAFGAHGVADPQIKALLQTGGQYGMVHALAAIAALHVFRIGGRSAAPAAYCFLAGGTVFSGSLYALALTRQHWFGPVTPVGGVLMLAGWAMLAWAGVRLKPST